MTLDLETQGSGRRTSRQERNAVSTRRARNTTSDSGPTDQLVDVRGLTKTYGPAGASNKKALDDVSISLDRGEFVVLLGPSGCGKTTLLRCVAGLEHPDDGVIEVRGKDMFSKARNINVAPENRNLSVVFQSYALWPHKNLTENVAYPLRCRGTSKAAAHRAAKDMLGTVGLGDRTESYPSQLSGGQQQRVAVARAIVANSDLVLFDEPLSNLDAAVREHIRSELLSLQREIGFAALYVTHDQSEAMALADTLVVMKEGTVVQAGSPDVVYSQPNSTYVAKFLGRANEFDAVVGHVGSAGSPASVKASFGDVVVATCPESVRSGDAVKVIARPEHIQLSSITDDSDATELSAEIVQATFLGGSREYDIRLGDRTLLVRDSSEMPFTVGERVGCTFPAHRVNIFPISEHVNTSTRAARV